MGVPVRGVFERNVMALTVAVLVSVPGARVAAETGDGTAAPVPRASTQAAAISGGHDKTAAWLVAEYRELQIRKRTEQATGTVAIEVQARGDRVSIGVSGGSVSVTRGSGHVAVDSARALESVQELLGSSPAVFALRGMLSELEAGSALTAPEMSLLSAAAFVASLVGDTGAPQRIADRFVAKHRGLFRQIRLPSGNCWSAYSGETTAAWNELQDCMVDADAKDFFRAAYERIACNAVWLLRAESAYFEYLNCLSPLGSISK